MRVPFLKPSKYKVSRLVDHRRLNPGFLPGLQIVCDIDKTYLETEFESVSRIIGIAFQAAEDKITVKGATDVLDLARWSQTQDYPAPKGLHFVSSSPPQLRGVLDEKFVLDGLDWDSDTFKNQAYNIRKRRVDLLRNHVAYKSLAITQVLLEGEGPFVFIGDNAESDAWIYLGIAFLCQGKLTPQGFRQYLEIAGVEGEFYEFTSEQLEKLRATKIAAILIRNAPGYHFVGFEPLTKGVQLFDNFFEAAVVMIHLGVIAPSDLRWLVRRFVNQHGLSIEDIDKALGGLKAKSSPDREPVLASIDGYLGETRGEPKGDKFEIAELNIGEISESTILSHAQKWADLIAQAKQSHV